jgi:Glycosyltransferase family 87
VSNIDEIAPKAATHGLAARIETYALVCSVTLLVVVALAALFADRGSGSQIGGDYPAFYGAGRIVLDGDGSVLYDSARQAESQEGLLADQGGYLYFAYPPFAAAGYAAVAWLPYEWSVAIHMILMAAALWLAVRLAAAWLPFVERHPHASYATALFFYPMLRAVIGGQNTAVTLVLLCAAAALERRGRHEMTGAVAALLLYKPQFGVPLLLLLVVARRWRALRGWLPTAAGLYLVGAAVTGWNWPSTWWSNASAFADHNVSVNGGLFVSVPGLLTHLAPDSALASGLGWAWIAVVAGAAALFWSRNPGLVDWRYAVAAVALVAVSPQPLYYEIGLLLLPVAVLAETIGSGAAFAAFWLLGAIELFDTALGFSPLVVITVAAVVAMTRLAPRQRMVAA